MHKYHSIWNTCEAYCFLRDFTYEDYVYVYERAFPGGKPFSKEFYSQFCSLLNTLMEKDFECKMSNRVEVSTIRAHKKVDGLFLIDGMGRCRYATLFERVAYWAFGTLPYRI